MTENARRRQKTEIDDSPDFPASFSTKAVRPFAVGSVLRAESFDSARQTNETPSPRQKTNANGEIQIVEVDSSKRLRQFVDFPWKIYRNDPCWTPPIKLDVRETLNPKKHPFYRFGWAKKFLAIKDSEVVGRILASDDPRFNEQNGTNLGGFGFFESIDDQNVADALLDRAAAELKIRGRRQIFGPIEYSTNYSCGLLIEGFDSPAKAMMPYNPSYYPELLTRWGLEKNRDLYSWWFDDSQNLASQWKTVAEKLNRRYQIQIRSFRVDRFQEDVENCMQVYDHFRQNWWWACVSLTREEIEHYAKKLRLIAHPEQILLAEVDGKPIGFSVTIPDVNEAAAPLDGSLSWFGVPFLGIFRLFWRLKRVKAARMMVLCVLPEYQRRGVAERLILETIDYGKNVIQYKEAELGWTDETNDKINRMIERIGAKIVKKYRVYDREI